jgi:hypothetical protein
MPDSAMTYQQPRSGTPRSSGGGVDLQTLMITAASSAAAAYACSKLWAPGTLAAAAFTPVFVALVKEALAKATDVVTRAVPIKGVVRSAHPQGPQPYDPTLEQPPAGAAPPPYEQAVTPAQRVAQPGEIQYHGRRGLRGWRLAVLTGLLGFLICAVVFTVPELVAGGSAAGGGRDTTIFGGGSKGAAPVVTQTTTVSTQTVTIPPAKTVTVPPPKTVTTPPPTVTTPPPTTTVPTTTVPGEPSVDQPPAVQPPG